MKIDDQKLFEVIKKMRQLYPDWRFGQMVCNIAGWTKESTPGSVWDVEDDEFLKAAEKHIKRRLK